MNFRKLLTLTLLTIPMLPGLAEAGALTDKAYQLAAQLGTREPMLTPAQQAQVNRQLDTLLATLNGQPSPERAYLCVSRDNDNSRPFVLAYKEFANVVRVNGAVFNSKDECEQSLAAGPRFMDRLFVCASRDNDGMKPYKIVSVNGATATILQRSVLGSFDDCTSATRAMQWRPEGILYCASRDNDGNHPYVQTGLKTDGTFVQSREEYQTLNECFSNL
jgi:hypothetical protein